MSFGLGRLGWPPETFWAATPREIAAALRTHQRSGAQGVIARTTLERLIAAHPDRRQAEEADFPWMKTI